MNATPVAPSRDVMGTRKVELIVFTVALALFAVAGWLAFLDRKAEVIASVLAGGIVCLVFAYLPRFKSVEVGSLLKAELMQDVKEQVDSAQQGVKSELDLVRIISFAGIISKYEMRHLRGLVAAGGYTVWLSGDLRNELKRLDDFGFILPRPGKGLNSVDQQYGGDINRYRQDEKTPFNLADFVQITEYGRKYLELADKLGMPERP